VATAVLAVKTRKKKDRQPALADQNGLETFLAISVVRVHVARGESFNYIL
jgi:hypothetical protein